MNWAVLSLFAALILFWFSTRQFPILVRLAIWVAAAGLLGRAAWSTIVAPDQFGLVHALLTSSDEGDSQVVRAIRLNAAGVAPFLQQLLDFFAVAGAVVGALSLLAFSKGERLERFLRPTLIGLGGFVGGRAATLAVVALGFGGYVRPRTFSVNAQNAALVQVHDGDTFRIGDFSLRLYGIDAPEGDQLCGNVRTRCGDTAREWLKARLSNGVQCDQTLSRTGRVRDALGRALVRCLIPAPNGSVDLSEEMVRQGYAVQFRGEDYGYNEAERRAQSEHLALMNYCSLRPDVWRNNRPASVAFARDGSILAGAATMGNCAAGQQP